MHADRISLALTRIEMAAARIGEAARPTRAAVGPDADVGDLGRRYQALRREAASALAELDELIARLER